MIENSFEKNIFLAPLAGVSDRAFRILCKEQGADMTFTEMISAKGVHYGSDKSVALAVFGEDEKPTTVQIFGHEPEILAEAAKVFEQMGAEGIDINMGCPMPKITSSGDGSALLKSPALAEACVAAVVKAVNLPVSVKMRRGYESKNGEQAVELARAVEAGGAAFVTVHGRYRDQLYSGKSDLGIIKKVKEAVKIPVIGNGDIASPKDVVFMRNETGCDGVMIGRGSYGDPWIFKRIKAYLKDGTVLPKPSAEEVKEMMLRHLDLEISFKGEYTGIREMRNHLSWYLKGYYKSAAMRHDICAADTAENLRNLISRFFEELNE